MRPKQRERDDERSSWNDIITHAHVIITPHSTGDPRWPAFLHLSPRLLYYYDRILSVLFRKAVKGNLQSLLEVSFTFFTFF